MLGLFLGSISMTVNEVKAIQVAANMTQLSQMKSKKKGSVCKYDSDSSDDEVDVRQNKKKLHNCVNTATQKDKLFRDKSSSFFTSAPVSIEETCIDKRKGSRKFEGCNKGCD